MLKKIWTHLTRGKMIAPLMWICTASSMCIAGEGVYNHYFDATGAYVMTTEAYAKATPPPDALRTPPDFAEGRWPVIISNYGLMPLVAGALYCLVHQRDKQIFALLDKYDAALKERIAEGKETVAAMTKMTATLDNLCVESEKTRVTAYQLRDMTIKQSDAIWEPDVRGNTRFLRKDE